MKKLLFFLTLSIFSLTLSNIEDSKDVLRTSRVNQDTEQSTNLNFIKKNFIEIPNLKASSLTSKAIKTLGSLTYGAIISYFYCKITGAIYFDEAYSRYNWSTRLPGSGIEIQASDNSSSRSLKIKPVRAIIGLPIASYAIWKMYNLIHGSILSRYQEQALKKIIEQYDQIKELIEPKFKNLLNNISIKYQHNRDDVDFGETAQRLRELIKK